MAIGKKLMDGASAAVLRWCKARELRLTEKPTHIHARAYVVGRAAPSCLIVAVPWVDSAPQCQKFNRENPLGLVYQFDESLQAGDWCTTAYIVHAGGGESVAIPVVA